MERKEISKAVIGRLPRYYRYLGELIEEGVERIEVSISNTAEHAMAFAVAEGAPRTGEKEVGG